MFTWDPTTGRYRNARGRFVPDATVRDAIDATIDSANLEVVALAERLKLGVISIADWQNEMARVIKNVAIAHTAIARGGVQQLTQRDYGRIGQWLAQGRGDTPGQYQALRGFAQALESGRQAMDGTFPRRAELYVEAGRELFHVIESEEMQVRGFTEYRSVLDAGAEHCSLCLEQAARGWVPIGELVPIGKRTCRTRDRCSYQYRRSDGLERAA